MEKAEKSFKVIISGGGTGGHVFPAIAIANAIKAKRPDTEILFVGAKGRMEMDKVPAAGYEIEGLDMMGLNRRQMWKNIMLPFKLISSVLQARAILRRFKPDVVVGVGGYASGPTLYMAGRMGIPYVIQEQNSYPGITNRILARKAKKICVDYDGMQNFFSKEKIVWTGNPIRQDICDLNAKREEAFAFFGMEPNKPVLLVMGGSLGAGSINNSMMSSVDRILDTGCQVLWQTGAYYFAQAVNKVKNKEGLLMVDFIRRMDLAYALADIVVSRAGAIAISELCVVGKPVILIPSPNVAEDHQTKNALALSSRNAAILLTDEKAQAEFGNTILNLMRDKRRQELMSDNILRLAKTSSGDDIAKVVFNVAKIAEN